MKKILVLGGTAQQKKFVIAAKELGLYVIVADYLPDSPAKKICDKAYNIDIKDVDKLEKICLSECVDAVVCGYIDPCQMPYYQLCSRLNIPCYGDEKQFQILSNKRLFKELCRKSGLKVIEEFSEKHFVDREISFPVFVKPEDSRGSRGQDVCSSYAELERAIECAKKESSNGKVIIEKYMEDADEIQVTYFFINGEAYLIRTVDSYKGSSEDSLDKVVVAAISPSQYSQLYIEKEHKKVIQMFKKLGIKNGPVFMQGFVKGGEFFYFDPGRRFPGVDYELIYKRVFGVDFARMLVEFALTGKMKNEFIPEDGVYLNGKKAAVLFPVLKEGTIDEIKGIEEIGRKDYVVSAVKRASRGMSIKQTGDINQRLAEIDIVANDISQLKEYIGEVYNLLSVLDTRHEEMILREFSPAILGAQKNETWSINVITQSDLIKANCFSVSDAINVCSKAFLDYKRGNVYYPDKISYVFEEYSQNRINCMPAGIKSEQIYGMKWVSVFPGNPHFMNVPNVSAVIVLSELKTGFPIAFMEGEMVTCLRTSAVGAIAASYLAKKNAEVIGFIGAGEQAKMHLLAILEVRPEIKKCKVASRTKESEIRFVKQMKKMAPEIEFIACESNYEMAVRGSDIIVSATSGQNPIIKEDWIEPGMFYCHVGGFEDEYGVAKKADKIVTDNWESVKHRSQTLSRMYKDGLICDCDIYGNLDEILIGEKFGRESENEFIYFNSVGLSYLDISLALWMYQKIEMSGGGKIIEMRSRSLFHNNN